MSAEATIEVLLTEPIATINPNLYGHFAEHLGTCIYGGFCAGDDSGVGAAEVRDDIVAALRRLAPPVLRWPGGCFADDYHWEDGVGPLADRPRRINIHWGEVVETNAFGTHEFMDLCEMIGADAYVSGNVGTGTPQEMMEWVEYMTSDSESTLAKERRQNGRDWTLSKK